ncbi:hypothetical protein OAO35_02890 [Euryarchaeota archaeon]|nr:hypothetical protein [Euryarchaeota archaeon]
MKKISLFFIFALVLFFITIGGTATGETFASVDLYISGQPNGQLRIEEPSGSSTETIVIADGESGQGTFQEVGRWTTNSFLAESNISGEWSGKAWISSNRDATVTLRYTVIQNDNNLDEFEFSGDVYSGETAQLTGSSDFSLQGLDESSITLLVESSWTAQPGSAPPPPTEGNTTITFDYGTDSSDTKVTIPISHLRMSSGSSPSLLPGQSEFYVYVEVSDVFGVDDVISLSKSDYSMQMAPSGESPWSSSVDKVSDKGDYVEVRFLWSFEGQTLPAGENTYNIEVDTTDLLSDLSWSKNLQTMIYIEPEPDAKIEAVTSTSKVVEFGKTALYTLSVRNSGSGSDEFIITYDNNDNWDVSVDIYDLTLDAGDSQNIKIGIMPSESASDGQESPTIITVTAASDSEVSDSLTLITTAKEPEPDFDFSIIINEQDNDNYDYSSDSFIIKDRELLEITFTVTNLGNEQNAFNLKFNSIDNAFSSNFDRSSLSSVSPDQNEIVVLTLTPRNDYYGTNTFVEIEVTSAGDSKTKMETIEIFLEQSGNIIGNSNLKLETSLGKSLTHTLKISNLDIDESNRIYFGVSGEAETWVTFKDKDGDVIAYSKFLTLLPAQLVDITLLISVPSYADTGSYEINIWMENDQKVRISEQYTFKIVATSAEESTESNVILYGVSMIALGGVLLYGYRNFNSYDDEDYEDYDELEDIPEFIDDFSSTDNNLAPQEIVPEPIPQAKVPEPIAPSIMPETAPLALSPEVVTQSEQLETPVKPKKKWFGLFGKSDPVPDVQPVAAEPVMAQPVAAEPVMAQPVAAEPVMAQPVAAEPVMAQPVAAEPVMAQPVVAEPVMAQPVVAEPVVAQPVAAEPIVVQAVAILPEDEV